VSHCHLGGTFDCNFVQDTDLHLLLFLAAAALGLPLFLSILRHFPNHDKGTLVLIQFALSIKGGIDLNKMEFDELTTTSCCLNGPAVLDKKWASKTKYKMK
jgi:hypothetical protein